MQLVAGWLILNLAILAILYMYYKIILGGKK